MRIRRTGLMIVGIAAGVLCGVAVGADEVCDKTSDEMLEACEHAAIADYRVALANCENLLTPNEREDCRRNAKRDRKSAEKSCKEQLKAREEVCDLLGEGPYHPDIHPDRFGAVIDNPYWPLTPGTTFIYEGLTQGGLERVEVTVTRNTRKIMGVTCVEVRDIVTLKGEVIEDTLDWYAQDLDGNVWYFGENVKDYEDGLIVSLEGSFTAGVDGAQPGIIMLAQPKAGDAYRQEFDLGNAEDLGEVLSLTESVVVPFGSFDDCLQTRDFTPMEPDALEHKFYAPGVGQVLTVNVETGERVELIDIIRG